MTISHITMALAGNPNSGKTTLFNALTGARQYVGNWPGVTVEKKEGKLKFEDKNLILVDLPGTYSLSPYSMEEIIAKNYIINERPDVVVNIVDASNIERNLFLTMQLLELGRPTVIALNMMDVAKAKGYEIDVTKLSMELGVPVVPIIASKSEGINELISRAITEADVKNQTMPQKMQAFVNKLEEKISGITDPELAEETKTDYTYEYIEGIIKSAVKKPSSHKITTSDKVDSVLTHKYLGLPIFALVMFFTFFFTYDLAGNVLNGMLDEFITGIVAPTAEAGLMAIGAQDWLISLVVDGIIGGVGGVIIFVPNVACLFLMISLIEDTGYMARVAFIMDRAMRGIGLSGKAFIPMVLGLGCSVPAIMSTRTLESEKDRLTTTLITPFVSCSARLPVYTLFAAAFFPGNEKYIVFSLYVLGVLVAILVGLIFKKTIFKADETPFIMELPPYRFPSIKNLSLHVWDRVKGYIAKAGTLIFGASVVLWFLLGFNMSGPSEINQSFGASIGKFFAPMLSTAGFGNWQAALSLFTGVIAKEIVISNMAIIYGIGESAGDFASALSGTFSTLSAYAFMVFVLLYTPCVAVIGVVKRETNSYKWTAFSVLYQLFVAWLVATIVYQVGSFFI